MRKSDIQCSQKQTPGAGVGSPDYAAWPVEQGVLPKISSVLAHVDVQVMLPLGDVPALGAHEVLVVGVGQHVLGQVAHIPAREVAELTLVRFLSYMQHTNAFSMTAR